MNFSTLWDVFNGAPLWVSAAAWTAVTITAFLGLRFAIQTIVASVRHFVELNRDTNGTGLFYGAAVSGMFVSVDTSWNFFGVVVHVDNLWARGVMFFVLEMAQIACGWGMRASIRKIGVPGPARLVAWTLCAVSAYMAWSLSGFWVGIARVVLGPILSLVMLHLALGIEVRNLKLRDDSTWIRIAHELRERFLAYFGLGDERRDAKAIMRQRALAKAAHIRMTSKGSDRDVRRFIKALAKAGIMDDRAALEQFLNSMKLAANASRVWGAQYGDPFDLTAAVETTETETVIDAEVVETVDETAQVNGGETVETAPRPASLTRRNDQAEAEIEALLQLMRERGSAEAASLDDAIDRCVGSRATAARRLAAARSRFTEAS